MRSLLRCGWFTPVFALFLVTAGYFSNIEWKSADRTVADPELPRHFTLVDASVAAGQLVEVPLWVEKYESAQIMHLRFEIDPEVAEFVGAVPGRDLRLLGNGGCWVIESESWVQTANERPEHPGWQLNYLSFHNSCTVDPCSEGITGPIGAHRELGVQTVFHIADIIIRGNAAGVTPIWIDRVCNGEPGGGGNIPGTRDSRMSWYVEDKCPGERFFEGGAHYCIQEPGPGLRYVTLSPEFLPAPLGKVGQSFDPVIVVTDDDDCDDAVDDDCVPVLQHRWGEVKAFYRE